MKYLFTLCILTLLGCSVTSPDRQAPPEKFEAQSTELSQEVSMSDPKVNILFVVDNSGSMDTYQKKMAENIEQFADTFFDNTRIDYRIGVVPVYDRVYLNDKTLNKKGQPRKMNELGELIPLKGLPDSLTPPQLFITPNTPNAKKVLKDTVLIGTQWGPEAEESFSPVIAATDPKKNNGFYQEDAYLVVIFLTDADDVTIDLSAEDFYHQLVQLKKGDRSKILIAAALPNLKDSSQCPRNEKGDFTDGNGPVQAFPSLLAVSGGIFADLCSDHFGQTLAEFGNQLVQRVATQKKQLDYTPDITTLKISYGVDGDQNPFILERPRDYTFNPETNEIILNPNLKIPKKENASIRISAKPISYGNFKSDRLKPLSTFK